MKPIIFRVAAVFFISVFGVFFTACVGESAQSNPVANQSFTRSQNCAIAPCSSDNQPIALKTVNKNTCQHPLIVGVDYDQTGSMRWSGTSSLSAPDLAPLIDWIADCGGEIGVTFVRADSAKPVERLRADEPPPAPVEPIQKPDEEDYEFADRMDKFRLNLQTRVVAFQRSRKNFQPKIDEYFNELAPLLAQKPKGNTDFWTSVNRLDVFLAESDASWRVKPRRYLIIVSDGADTIGKEKHALKSDAVIIWVNANASEKNLKDFPYQRVESFPAAVIEILAGEGVK